MPRRPLSAYNFFFGEERERVLASIPDPDGEGDEKKEKVMDEKESNDKDETKIETSENTAATTSNPGSKPKDGESVTDERDEIKKDDEKEAAEKMNSNTKRLLALRESQSNTRRPHRKTHGKIGFKALAKLIGERWRALSPDKKEYYVGLAETDLARYKEQMKEYNHKNKWAFLGETDRTLPK